MKTITRYFILACVVINLYYGLVWIQVYNHNATQQKRVDQFLQYFPTNSVVALTVFLIVITVASIVVLSNLKQSTSRTIAIALQAMFAVFFAWQSL